jgi:hypothetical protein
VTRQPYASQCPRAYTRTGRTAHLLPPFASLNTDATALCGTSADAWYGSGSQDETETLGSLPVCKRCEGHARAADEAGRRIAGMGHRERASPAPVPPDPAAGTVPRPGRGALGASPGCQGKTPPSEPDPPPGLTAGSGSPARGTRSLRAGQDIPLSGEAFREQWGRARSARSAALRGGRGRYRRAAAGGTYRPGMARRTPGTTGGAL